MICLFRAFLAIGLSSIARLSAEVIIDRSIVESTTPSLGCEILAVEGEVDPNSAIRLKLDRLIESAEGQFDAVHVDGEAEVARARRFFEAVDRALIEADVIFPPNGEIDFLRDGLQPRALSETEFTHAETRFANARRLPWMRANQQSGGEFYFFDCDLAAVVYVTAAERLGFPVFVVEVPGHSFVRWESGTVKVNWDPNDGISYPNNYYVTTWRVPSSAEIWPRFFESLSRARMLSTWSVLCGREKQSRGDYEGALSHFRRAVQTDSSDLGAANELAWILATCPVKNLRNGQEAVALARANVGYMRRAVWLQTLAAAHAEVGDFKAAIACEQEAQRCSSLDLGWAGPRETLRNHDLILDAYERSATFVESTAVEARD